MDAKRSLYHTRHNHLDYPQHRADLFVQTDGGCRKQSTSATGWVIKAVQDNNIITLASGSTLFAGNYYSLAIEALALDEAITWLNDAILKTLSSTSF